jgi:transcriptional regulator with XRE-family HTH domain
MLGAERFAKLLSQDLMNCSLGWFVRWNNGMHAKFNSQQYATKATIRRSAGTGVFTENVFGADARPPIKMALFMFARVEKKSPNPVDKHVGRRVRMRRMMLAMSQEKLGNALGLTFQQVQKYEKGTNRIGASRLQQISHILQVPVAFFFEGAPNLHGSTDRMKDAPSPSYVSDFLATPRRALADKGFHADQRTQA